MCTWLNNFVTQKYGHENEKVQHGHTFLFILCLMHEKNEYSTEKKK